MPKSGFSACARASDNVRKGLFLARSAYSSRNAICSICTSIRNISFSGDANRRKARQVATGSPPYRTAPAPYCGASPTAVCRAEAAGPPTRNGICNPCFCATANRKAICPTPRADTPRNNTASNRFVSPTTPGTVVSGDLSVLPAVFPVIAAPVSGRFRQRSIIRRGSRTNPISSTRHPETSSKIFSAARPGS